MWIFHLLKKCSDAVCQSIGCPGTYIVLQNQNLFFSENPDPSLVHLINEIHEMMKKEPEKFQSFFRKEEVGQKLYRLMDDFSNEQLVHDLYKELKEY